MNDRVLAELFAQPVPEPPLPPGHLEQLLSVARRTRRRNRLRRALIGLVTAMLATVVPGALLQAGAGVYDNDKIHLADELSGYWPFTATVADHPPGRSLVLMSSGSYELFHTSQTLMIATDGRTYRDLDDLSGAPLLSPDGMKVITVPSNDPTSSLTLVDLITGGRRSIPLENPSGVMLHAWSNDLRYVSYSTIDAGDLNASTTLEECMRVNGVLSILDLATGRSTRFPQLRPARASAFTPDSRALAVQLAVDEAWVIGLDGVKQRRLALPSGTGIAPGVAWSPDGRMLATVRWTERSTPAHDQRAWWTGYDVGLTIGFADADGKPLSDPGPVDGRRLVGWRSPRSIITITFDFPTAERQTATIEEVALGTGQVTVLSHLDHGHACEAFTQMCLAGKFQMATGLLGSATVRSAGLADRGPLATGAITGFLALIVFLAVLIANGVRSAVLLLRRRRRR